MLLENLCIPLIDKNMDFYYLYIVIFICIKQS
jgi:hypothetical protein